MRSILKLRLLRLKDEIWVYVLMMVMAFGLTAVFGISFNEYRPSVLIVDECQSGYSQQLAEELSENTAFRFTETDLEQAAAMVREGKTLAAVIIGQDFNRELSSDEAVGLRLMRLKEDLLLLTLKEQLTGAVSKIAGSVKISSLTADYIKAFKPAEDRNSIEQSAYESVMDAWDYKRPVVITSTVSETGAEAGYDGLKHSMIGFSLFFSMYGLVFGIGTILYDREHRTWQRMLISPVSRTAILGGSMIVTFFTGMLQLGILILAGKYLLDIDWGQSLLGVLLVAAAFVFAVTSLGLLMSGFVKTHAQLGSITPVVLTSTSMLGGCMWPLDIVSNKILLFLAELTPQKWAMQGMESIASRGMGLEAAFTPVLVLVLMGLIFFAGGVWLIKFE